jgi:hypothetical protein
VKTKAMNYEIVCEWEIDGRGHDMHLEENQFGAAMQKYLEWVAIVSRQIAMAGTTAAATVTITRDVDVFFKFSMQVE